MMTPQAFSTPLISATVDPGDVYNGFKRSWRDWQAHRIRERVTRELEELERLRAAEEEVSNSRTPITRMLCVVLARRKPVQQHDVRLCLRYGRVDVLTVTRPRDAACDHDGSIAEVGHRRHRSTRGR